jgi:hypothetical protein
MPLCNLHTHAGFFADVYVSTSTLEAIEYRRTKGRFEHRIFRLELEAGRTPLDSLDA